MSTVAARAPRPRRLLVLNPNCTVAMTDGVLARLRQLAGERIVLRGLTAPDGPPVIATREAFAAGAAAAQRALAGVSDVWADAVLLACYGDPGLDALRAQSPVPVLGMAESSVRDALARGRPFHILTAGREWGPMLRDTVARHAGATTLLDGVTTLDTTGLAASEDRAGFVRRVQAALDTLAAAGAPDCVLGGAGFAGLEDCLHYPGRLTDGLRTALAALDALAPKSERPR
ncbi:MAG: Asp/Glu racemase [Variovorax sp.]|nr:Asp/Glu racemase [Variovorax sp.]